MSFLAAHVLDRARVDARIARHHHRAHAADVADAADHAAAGDRLGRIRIVEAIARHRGELQPGRAEVEQPGDAFARQQLAALVEQRLGFSDSFLVRSSSALSWDTSSSIARGWPGRFRKRVELRLDRRHQPSTLGLVAR
jgi:hypothetical protein